MWLLKYLKEKHDQAPTTSGTLMATFRQGLLDLQSQVLNLSHDGMKGHEVPGMAGHPTTYDVYQERHAIQPPSKAASEPKLPSEPDKGREPEIG